MSEREDETPHGWGLMKPPAPVQTQSSGAIREDETVAGWDGGRGQGAPLPFYRDPSQPPIGSPPPPPMMQRLAQLLGPAARAGGMGNTQQMAMLDPAKKQQMMAFIQSLVKPGAGPAMAAPPQPQRGYGPPGMTRMPPPAGPRPLSPQSPILRPPILDDLL